MWLVTGVWGYICDWLPACGGIYVTGYRCVGGIYVAGYRRVGGIYVAGYRCVGVYM